MNSQNGNLNNQIYLEILIYEGADLVNLLDCI